MGHDSDYGINSYGAKRETQRMHGREKLAKTSWEMKRGSQRAWIGTHVRVGKRMKHKMYGRTNDRESARREKRDTERLSVGETEG